MASDIGESVPEELRTLLLELLSIPDEERTAELVQEINRLSPDPEWSAYIFHSDDFLNEDGSTNVDAVIAKMMEDRSIQL